MGRLIFLNYFRSVEFESYFEEGRKRRTFVFNDNFDRSSDVSDSSATESGTTIRLTGYRKDRIYEYDYLRPAAIKDELRSSFFPLLYAKKSDGVPLKVTITLSTEESVSSHDFFADKQVLEPSQLPQMKQLSLECPEIDLVEQAVTLHYRIDTEMTDNSIISAVVVDERTIPVKVVRPERLPIGCQAIFLLESSYYEHKSDAARQALNIPPSELTILKRILTTNIGQLLRQEIPTIEEANDRAMERLAKRYPHLSGYVEPTSVGIMDEDESIDVAQKRFFLEQKKVLEATDLTDDVYESSLQMANRVLAEYVLYRQLIIKKLRDTNPTDTEADIHRVIIPMKRTFDGEDLYEDLYSNNAWLLDDKFMNYRCVLSDEEIDKLLGEIADEEVSTEGGDQRPDIAVVLSDSLSADGKVDVVIVELKRKGIDFHRERDAVGQLRQRARKVWGAYPDKVQRVWFYGIIEFTDELLLELKGDHWIEIFSTGRVMYREYMEVVDIETDQRVPVGVFLMSYDAIWEDAQARNATFLEILKKSLSQSGENQHVVENVVDSEPEEADAPVDASA